MGCRVSSRESVSHWEALWVLPTYAIALGRQGFQDVLLDGEIVVADGRQLVSQLGQVFDSLLDPIVGDVIGRCFGAQAQVIADILLEKALSIMTTNHGVWKLQILNNGLKLSLVLLGDLATERSW